MKKMSVTISYLWCAAFRIPPNHHCEMREVRIFLQLSLSNYYFSIINPICDFIDFYDYLLVASNASGVILLLDRVV